MTELVVFEKLTPLTVFSDGGATPLLEAIKKRVAEMPQDISTKEGREAIRSGAYEIARTKTTIDKMREKLVAEEKARLKKIDAEGAKIWDELETLQKSYRAPLTEWENKEKDRVAGHEGQIALLTQCAVFTESNTLTAEQIQSQIDKANEIYARDWQEFATRAALTKDGVIKRLETKLAERKKYEAEQAELERLRKAEAERQQREREEAIKAEAAAEAKAEAEAEAAKAAEAEAKRVAAEKEKAEQERQRIQKAKEESDRQAKEAEARAKKAEEDRLAAIAKAEADRKAAAAKSKADAEAAAAEAAKAERERIEAEQRKEREETAKREADKKHRAAINNEVLNAIVNECNSETVNITPEIAKAVVEAIAKGKIPHVKLSY